METLASIPQGSKYFACCTNSKRNVLYVIHQTDGLFKYVHEANEWTKCTTKNELSEGFIASCYCTAIMNTDKNEMYFLNETISMAILKIQNENISKVNGKYYTMYQHMDMVHKLR